MNNYQSYFRTDLLNAIFSLTGKTWLNIAYAYLIYMLAALVIVGGLAGAIIFTGVIDFDLFNNIPHNSSPEDTLDFLRELSTGFLTPSFLLFIFLMFIVIMIIASWNYYFAFIAVDSEVKGHQFSFSQLLNLSLNYGIAKVIGVSILMNIIIVVLFFAAIMSAKISGLLAFVLFLVASVIVFRFILVLPAYIIGNKDLNNSFAFSFYHINWIRALKLFGISILGMLALLIAGLIIGLISGMLSFIPFIGPLIQMAINAFLGAIMMAFIVSAVVGLYYRYAEDIDGNNEDIIADSSELD